MKRKQLNHRISDELAAKLDKATDRTKDPYAPTISQLVEHGLELAIKEYETRRSRGKT